MKSKYFRIVLICLVPLLLAVYSIWYWSSDYLHLLNWYKGLNPGFYHADDFARVFFTNAVKSQGNWWCLAALVAAISWVFLVWRLPGLVIPKLNINKKSILVYSGISLAGIVLSVIANLHSKYAADEVFSALNFASIPVFQRVSYYALPNNHVFFNFINGIIFFWSNDLVQSGRLISLCCYVAVLCLSWYFLKKWILNFWMRCISLSVLAVLFPVWGFSGQARGYELVLLLSVISFITFWLYWSDKKQYLLYLHSICNIAGMLTVPTYLFWWTGLLLTALLFMIWMKQIDRNFIKFSLASVLMTFILYLPVLSFSGLTAIAGNRYVKPENSNLFYYMTHLNSWHYFNGLFNEWFCSGMPNLVIGIVCILLPFLIFFYPPNDLRYRKLIILYLSMMIAFFLLVSLMKTLPFYRNMIAHAYLAWMFILITFGSLLRLKKFWIAFGLIFMTFMVFSAYTNFRRMPEDLYFYKVTAFFNKLYESKTEFKAGSTVYLDDESVYWWYVLRYKYPDHGLNIKINRPSFNGQDYCIIINGTKPPADTTFYRKIESWDEYEIYERKK